MANQHVIINGEKYGIWYMHSLDPDIIERSLEDAFNLGQIEGHVNDAYAPYVTHVTRCQLEREDRSVVSVGYAFCSENDNFAKKRGRNISLSRAIQWLRRN